MSYIHELPQWPEFTWDMQALAQPLAETRYKQGKHLGRMEALGVQLTDPVRVTNPTPMHEPDQLSEPGSLMAEANLAALTNEIVKSSAIEGEKLDTQEVRSSIARKLGMEIGGLIRSSRNTDALVEIMLDATRNFSEPLTVERLCNWHGAMFPVGRSGMHLIDVGQWRSDNDGPMRVVSGPVGRERIHFEAPAADRIESEMDKFLHWFNHEAVDPVLRAGIAHFWFVTIHPFDDGNGRLARTIADMALAQAEGMPERFYSMSAQIEAERNEYYLQLESAQHGSLDITAWLAWFIGCLGRSIDGAEKLLGSVLYKARLWQRVNEQPVSGADRVSERQRLVINRMLEEDWQGFMNSSKYAKLNKCSTDTALRDITDLMKRGIFLKNEGGGRSTSYHLITPEQLQP